MNDDLPEPPVEQEFDVHPGQIYTVTGWAVHPVPLEFMSFAGEPVIVLAGSAVCPEHRTNEPMPMVLGVHRTLAAQLVAQLHTAGDAAWGAAWGAALDQAHAYGKQFHRARRAAVVCQRCLVEIEPGTGHACAVPGE